VSVDEKIRCSTRTHVEGHAVALMAQQGNKFSRSGDQQGALSIMRKTAAADASPGSTLTISGPGDYLRTFIGGW